MAGRCKTSQRYITMLFGVIVVQLIGYLPCSRAATQTYSYVDLYTVQVPDYVAEVGYSMSFFDGPFITTTGGFATELGGPAWGGENRAFFWTNAGVPINLHPSSGFIGSIAVTAAGGQQIGYGYNQAPFNLNSSHALLWNGTNAPIDLNPTGMTGSQGIGIGGGQQVGFGIGTATNGYTHALLWSGSNIATDLNPSGFDNSEAYATDGTHQVGVGYGASTNNLHHALTWSGGSTAIDLNPADFTQSDAVAVNGNQTVGYGKPTNNDSGNYIEHALLWNGTNEVDLNPAGFTSSMAFDTNGSEQVGGGNTLIPLFSTFYTRQDALLWNGSNTAIDLSTFLPQNLYTSSTAYAIDSTGNVFGMATDRDGHIHVVEWTVNAPEPTCPMLSIGVFSAALLRRRRTYG